jgi:hypothetical protein
MSVGLACGRSGLLGNELLGDVDDVAEYATPTPIAVMRAVSMFAACSAECLNPVVTSGHIGCRRGVAYVFFKSG